MPSKRRGRISKARRPAARRPTTRRASAGAPRKPAARRKGAAPKSAPKSAPATVPQEAPIVPSAIGCVRQHMDYTSQAMDEVRRFYTEVLGFTAFHHDPRFDYLTVQTGSSSSVGFMPPVPGPPEQWRPPREPAIYFLVRNVDAVCKRLSAKGVSFLQEPTDMPWGHRAAILRDPEGRSVWLAQAKRS